MNKAIKILIVDDEILIVNLLKDYLSEQKSITVQKTLSSGNALLQYLENNSENVDVILLELRMNDGTGIEAMEVIHKAYAHIKVIALSSYFKTSYTGHLIRMGFSGFLPKGTDKETLLEVIYSVYEKGHYFKPG